MSSQSLPPINPSINIEEHVSLQPYNTLAIPATTRWFTRVNSESQLKEVLGFCREQRCDWLLLGGGSNVVLANDFSGLAIQLNLQGVRLEQETDTHIKLSVAAGENWHDTVMYCVEKHWYGLENLALIPGSVGAAPIQNIGAYGVDLEQCFDHLEAMNIATGEMQVFDKKACEFAYRDSVFKHRCKDQWVITRVVLILSKQPQWQLHYPALQTQLSSFPQEKLTARVVADAVIAIRQSKLPDPDTIPNAGSFFKNPIVSDQDYHRLKQRFPELVAYAQNTHVSNTKASNTQATNIQAAGTKKPNTQPLRYKLAAGWLIDHAGWKGKEVDGFAMHKDQALVLTNPNQLSGQALLAFVEQVKSDIKQKYSINLEVEPRIYT